MVWERLGWAALVAPAELEAAYAAIKGVGGALLCLLQVLAMLDGLDAWSAALGL